MLLPATACGVVLMLKQLTIRNFKSWRAIEAMKLEPLTGLFRVEEIAKGSNLYRVRVRRSKLASEVLITDVGFGVSQILPVLVLCYYASEGSTILLEQPEIHLHPSVPSRHADVFIDACNVRNVQFIIESHSEHLLRRLQRRIAERKIAHDRTALYSCDIAEGVSELQRLAVSLYGEIRSWPKDFCGNEMEDIAAMSDAALRHRGIQPRARLL